MDPHPGAHHVLLQTSHSQVRSLGPADARGTVCTQGRDRNVVKALTEISFPCPVKHTHNQTDWVSEVIHFLLWKLMINKPLAVIHISFPQHRLLLLLLTSAAEFTLHISNIPNPFHLALYRICPQGEPSLFSPCPRRTHTGRAITHMVTPVVAHISRGEKKHLELDLCWKSTDSCPSPVTYFHINWPLFLSRHRWSEMSCC